MKIAAVLALWLGLSSAAGAAMPGWVTGESRPEDLVVYLVTFGPGDEVFSWFGHTGLVVEDRRTSQARLYNYGMFSFNEKMLARFAMGRLTFWVGEDPVQASYRFYKEQGRDVRIQELNLSPTRRAGLAKALGENVLPQNRDYLYHHYDDNCATRPRDMVDRFIDGQLKSGTQTPARMSLRDHTRRHAAVNAAMSLLLDFLMNDEIDRPILKAHEAFLPEELERQVAELSYVDETGAKVPLVARAWTYFDAPRTPVPEQPPALGPWALMAGLLLGAIPPWIARKGLAARWRRVCAGLHAALVGLVFGIPGLGLAIMWAITNHTVTFRNENLFLANPLTFAALPLGIAWAVGSTRAGRWLARLWYVLSALGLLGVALKVLPVFNQDNWRIVGLILPVSLGLAAGAWLDERSRRLTEERACVPQAS